MSETNTNITLRPRESSLGSLGDIWPLLELFADPFESEPLEAEISIAVPQLDKDSEGSEDSLSSIGSLMEADDDELSDGTCTPPADISLMKTLSFADFRSVMDERLRRDLKIKAVKAKRSNFTCKARSIVAMSRPRSKGKFIKKVEFISVTELQPPAAS